MEDQHCAEHSAHDRAIGVHDGRLADHGRQLDALNETLAALREIERQNQERIDRMDARLADIEAAPGRMWGKAVTTVVTAAITFALGIVAAHFSF